MAENVVLAPETETDSIQTEVKRLIFDAWCASGMSKSELARRIGCREVEARRILNLGHPTKIKTLQVAASALGYRLSLTIEPLA